MDISILGRQMYAIKQVIRFADDQEDKKGQIASFFCPSRGRWKENVPPRGVEAETRQGKARQHDGGFRWSGIYSDGADEGPSSCPNLRSVSKGAVAAVRVAKGCFSRPFHNSGR